LLIHSFLTNKQIVRQITYNTGMLCHPSRGNRQCTFDFGIRSGVEAMFFSNFHRRFDQSQLYDWTMRIPIVAYSLFVLIRDIHGFYDQILAHPAMFEQPDSDVVIAALARISQWMFIALLAILPVFRLRPIAKSENILPRLVALFAVCMPPMFMLLERAPASLLFNSVSVVLSVTANVMSVVTLSFLGRSLSVMPEARQLVMRGPYGIVRHPLYLCEILGVIAIVLQYRSFAAMTLFVLIFALQIARAHWEEAVLARAFSDFETYRLHTPFLIPRDPVGFLAMFFVDPIARRRSALVVSSTVGLLALVLTMLPRLGG
jgi:protein-S-isoprenylcysteine O-methyltransferase Ste14